MSTINLFDVHCELQPMPVALGATCKKGSYTATVIGKYGWVEEDTDNEGGTVKRVEVSGDSPEDTATKLAVKFGEFVYECMDCHDWGKRFRTWKQRREYNLSLEPTP